MTPIFSAAPLAAIGVLILTALVCRFSQPRIATSIARLGAFLTFAAVATAAIGFTLYGSAQWPAAPATILGFGVRVDPLNLLAMFVVSFVGVVVINFSRSYLDGNPRQAVFFSRLAATLAAVMLLVSSATLLQLLTGWVLTSLTLHQLLLFYPDRPLAILAARKKFWLARIGDLALLAAAALLIREYGTIEISAINNMAAGGSPQLNSVAASLLVVAALLKSAQFPLHGWLTEVMETPTPVSALLHAGIVNAGGYLMIRFADVVMTSQTALLMLIVVGGTSAVIASLIMLTQTSVKGQLGYSTVAQMGFMLLQCGLGAFASAGLHLVAHSFYKAHSFLTSGSAVDQVREWRLSDATQQRITTGGLLLTLMVALGIYSLIALAANALFSYAGGVFALGVVYIIGLCGFLARGLRGRTVLVKVIQHAALATVLYFSLQAGVQAYFASTLPTATALTPIALVVTALIIVAFALVALLQFSTAGDQSNLMKRIYLATRKGFYFNDYLNRIAGAYRRVSN
ncbi:MAG: NADH-quinone oxidoreductase subunit L [Pseudomonadota bacterium]